MRDKKKALTPVDEIAEQMSLEMLPSHTKKVENIVEVRRRRESKEQDVGFSSRPFILCSLPINRPPSHLTEYVRTNGRFTLTIVAPSKLGLPWGAFDRLLILWLATTAHKTQSRLLQFRTIREIFELFGIQGSGPQYKRMEEAISRVFGATFYIEEKISDQQVERVRRESFTFIRATEDVRLQPRRGRPSTSLTQEAHRIVLSEEFYSMLQRHPIPVDLAVVRTLSNAPGALDFYLWLAFRCKVAKKTSYIPLFGPDGLESQMGLSESLAERQFRRRVKDWLGVVKASWQDCPASLSEDGKQLIVRHAQAINDPQ